MQADPIGVVAALLTEVARTEDPALVLAPAAVEAVRRLAETVRAGDDLRARHLLGWSHWFRYLALPDDEDHEAWDAAASTLTSCFVAGMGDLPEPLLPVLAHHAADEAEERLATALRADNREGLEAVLGLWRRIVAATPADNPRLPGMLANLATAQQAHFPWSADADDLGAAIATLRRAAALPVVDSIHRDATLSNLAGALRARFLCTGRGADLDEAIVVMRDVLEQASVDDPRIWVYRSNLSSALIARFERHGTQADLDEAINGLMDTCSAAAESGSADLPATLSSLGAALELRFDRTADDAALNLAVKVGRLAADAVSRDHPRRHRILGNLANSLRRRAERRGDHADLDAAIAAGREAVAAAPPDHGDRATTRSNLSALLHARYKMGGVLDDLDEAIGIGQDVLAGCAADDPVSAMQAVNLADAWLSRHRCLGTETDRERGLIALAWAATRAASAPLVRITAARKVAELTARSDPDKARAFLDIAVRLVPVVASRRLGRDDQEFALRRVAGLASDAAAMTLAASTDAPDAMSASSLQLLELGRAVMFSRVLRSHGDLAELRTRNPEAARRLSELRDELNLLDSSGHIDPVRSRREIGEGHEQ